VSAVALSHSGRRGLGVVGDVLARPAGWFVLLAVLGVFLALGSMRAGPSSALQRVAYLDGVIKCPPCSDISIAQSDLAQSKALRSSVRVWVGLGWSNSRIEQRVVALYGPDEILRPTSPVIWIVPIVLLSVAVLVLGTIALRRKRADAGDEDIGDEDAGDSDLVTEALAQQALAKQPLPEQALVEIAPADRGPL
jgi:cytochrome c-type biogenesis protein CcmH/NrfF